MSALWALVAVLYAGAAAVLGWSAFGPRRRVERLGLGVLLGAVICHLGLIGSLCHRGLNPLLDTRGISSLTALLLTAGFILINYRWRLPALGSLLAFLACALVAVAHGTPNSTVTAASGTLPALRYVHLALVAVGLSSLSLAAGTSGVYLWQEAALKRRRGISSLRQTPALEALDRLARGLTLVGFPIFTLALLTGVIWLISLPDAVRLRPQYVFSGAIWLLFGWLLVSRVTVGVSGRRAALMTVTGFSATLLVLLSYAVRLWLTR